VLGLADAEYDALRPELRQALTEYYRVSDMHNYDELVRALGYFTHRYGKLDRLDSMNEYWLETEARLREDFNTPSYYFLYTKYLLANFCRASCTVNCHRTVT